MKRRELALQYFPDKQPKEAVRLESHEEQRSHNEGNGGIHSATEWGKQYQTEWGCHSATEYPIQFASETGFQS